MNLSRFLTYCKWLSLIIIVLAIWPGYRLYKRCTAERQYQEAEKHAIAAAHVWVASATLRDDPAAFLAFRDSVLSAEGLSSSQMTDYIAAFNDRPEDIGLFAELVRSYIDSLYAEPSIALEDTSAVVTDSAAEIDKITQ